jgi:hypothetical protein
MIFDTCQIYARRGLSAIFPGAARCASGKLRRVEVLALHLRADPMHDSRTNLATASELGGDLLQEGVATLDRKRPRGGENGVELGIG